MSIIKMRGPIDVLFAFKIFSLPVPTRPGTRTFLQVPDPSRPEVKNLYPSDPGPRTAPPPPPFLTRRAPRGLLPRTHQGQGQWKR